jgi:hypothetical protein
LEKLDIEGKLKITSNEKKHRYLEAIDTFGDAREKNDHFSHFEKERRA